MKHGAAAVHGDIGIEAARRALGLAPVTTTDDADDVEFSSPACSMHELDDMQRGYFNADELLRELNGLLELCVVTNTNTVIEAEMAQQEWKRWRVLLMAYIKSIGGVPCSELPPTHHGLQVTAADEAKDGLNILYLECMAQKLRRILPRIRDNRLHSDLREMLRRYEAKITGDGDSVAAAR
jgi:hypothetical protein